MSNTRQLHFDLNQYTTADGVRREVKLKADGELDAISILYDLFDTQVGDLAVLDGLVQGVLLHCMKRGLPLRIHGDISASAAHNLHEFQRAWVLWKPDVYRHIDLIPDSVVTLGPRSNKVIQAFSGGVDANFTLISNKELHKERGGYEVSAALLVHGFDVAYDNTAGFAKLVERVRKTLDRLGVELKLLRTNSRMLNIQSWRDSYALQLTACLHQFSNHYGRALMASAEPYDRLCLPISSSPITDPLLSGDLMTVLHDGAGYSRTEKVAALCKFPFLIDQIKVCWEGRLQHQNCGRCEKCLRTRLNFAAAGENEPSCFPGPFKTAMLRKLRATSAIQIAELQGILDYVQRHGLSYPWTGALKRRILLSRLAMPVDKLMARTKLRESLRSVWRAVRNKSDPAPAGNLSVRRSS